jgi:NAD+ kinase
MASNQLNPQTANGEPYEVSEEVELGSSDGESMQERLEVVFNTKDAQRRRASMVSSAKPSRPGNPRQKTGCFLHAMLGGNVKKGHFAPNPASISASQPSDKDHPADYSQVMPAGEDEVHRQSRLLTKKELSDMASGVRNLAKQLAHVRLRLHVRNVFILTKAHDTTLIAKTRNMAEWLLQSENAEGHPYTVWVEETMKNNKCFSADGSLSAIPGAKDRLKYWTNELCKRKPLTFDICVCLGGDGTVLYASWLFQRVVPPVMSFALGSLGFLTKFDFDNYREILTKAVGDGVTVSLRLRFEGTIMRSQQRGDEEQQKSRDLVDELIGDLAGDPTSHRPDGVHSIMNDIVLDRGPNPTMSAIEMFGDDEHFTTVQGDGLCVATPTGSTAYNLAAGGSLCHPENPVMLVTAIAPHTLSFRPIILPDTTVLRLGVPYDARASCWASFDGKERSVHHPCMIVKLLTS